jgi:hypothetical protein
MEHMLWCWRQLPIIGVEQDIMEGINRNDVVASGSWKASTGMMWSRVRKNFQSAAAGAACMRAG